MLKENRSQFAAVLFLVLIGAWFMLDKLFPEFHVLTIKYTRMPDILVLIGGVIIFFGIVMGEPSAFAPGMAVLGFGKILSYQTAYGGISSGWFMWSLLPVFIGAGMIIASLFEEEENKGANLKYGFTLLGVGAILFIILMKFFG